MSDHAERLAEELLEHLACAFGGWSQFSDDIVGRAIAGHHNNGGHMTKVPVEDLIAACASIIDTRWECSEATRTEQAIRAGYASGAWS
jgi:hypothetical protein